ncbi:MAG: transcription antitermination protein NusB, partial [Muribaculaceae bacterium]|nr:transcription antitermination protein NusB [Muribaculaceae bacterium]
LLKMSGLSLGVKSGKKFDTDPVIQKIRVGRSLRNDPAVQQALKENNSCLDKYDEVVPELIGMVCTTQFYAEYKKRKKLELVDDVNFWTTLFATIVLKNKNVEQILRSNPNYSRVGLEAGMQMFIKTLNTFDDSRLAYNRAKEELDISLEQAYSLYIALLYLPVLITERRAEILEENKNKYLPTKEDLYPNTRLTENLFVKALSENARLRVAIDSMSTADPMSWNGSSRLVNTLLDNILQSELYKEYAESPAGDFATDAAFWRDAMRTIILPSDILADTLEDSSVYWNDDLNIIGTFVLKTIRRSYTDGEDKESTSAKSTTESLPTIEILPKFLNRDDQKFGLELFELVVKNREQYRAYIDAFIDNRTWDTERLAFMDIVLMLTAIAEIINFPTIPVPVTCNEYIEIANDYSTPRSGQFVNGILSSVVKMLKSEGIINK